MRSATDPRFDLTLRPCMLSCRLCPRTTAHRGLRRDRHVRKFELLAAFDAHGIVQLDDPAAPGALPPQLAVVPAIEDRGQQPEERHKRRDQEPDVRRNCPLSGRRYPPARPKKNMITIRPMPAMGLASPNERLDRPENGQHCCNHDDCPKDRQTTNPIRTLTASAAITIRTRPAAAFRSTGVREREASIWESMTKRTHVRAGSRTSPGGDRRPSNASVVNAFLMSRTARRRWPAAGVEAQSRESVAPDRSGSRAGSVPRRSATSSTLEVLSGRVMAKMIGRAASAHWPWGQIRRRRAPRGPERLARGRIAVSARNPPSSASRAAGASRRRTRHRAPEKERLATWRTRPRRCAARAVDGRSGRSEAARRRAP